MRMIYTYHPHVSIPLKVSRYRRTPTMHADSAAFRLRHVRRLWELYAGIPNSGGIGSLSSGLFLFAKKPQFWPSYRQAPPEPDQD